MYQESLMEIPTGPRLKKEVGTGMGVEGRKLKGQKGNEKAGKKTHS